MSHSRLFDQLRRIIRLGRVFDAKDLPTHEGFARLDERLEQRAAGMSRRTVLRGAAAFAAGATLTGLTRRPVWAKQNATPRVAVVGGGLAGLVCMDRLQSKGVIGTLYEANDRLGGRVHSDRSTFPGQVAEAGGELIDNLHKTMLSYANEFNLLKEDYGKSPGVERYHFFGGHHEEIEVVEQYRVLVGRMRPDLQALSAAPSFFAHSAADVLLDNTDLGSYLARHCADLPLIHRVLEQAYVAEYGLELSEQSCLNLLLFIHLDGSAKFRPYGVFSDERYHLTGGNDAIVTGIRNKLVGNVVLECELERLSRNASGEYQLKFKGVARPAVADAVVLAMPFSVLRRVTLDPSLGLSSDKLRAIQELGYGVNCKTMIGFTGRPWAPGGNGGAYSDLPNLQNTWETNYSLAGANGILTDYAGGNRARDLQVVSPPPGQSGYCSSCHGGSGSFFDIDDTLIQQQASAFLVDLEQVFPGALAAARRDANGRLLLRRAHWLPQKYSRGSYTCYRPGQFTSIAGLEGQAVGALKFAGEHADSFYSWQGFMEGACLSGIAAANAVLEDIRSGWI